MSKFARCYRPLHPTGEKQMKKKPYKKVFVGWILPRDLRFQYADGIITPYMEPYITKDKLLPSSKHYRITIEEVKQ